MRTFLLTALLLLLAAGALAAEERDGLTAREAAAVRKALYGLNFAHLRNGREETVLRETTIGTPSLTEEERERIADHLWNHVPTKLEVQELLNMRRHWRKRSTDLFVFWWNPRHRTAEGTPSRSPTTLEATTLEEVARAAGERFAVEPPAWMPYRIEPREEASRTWPRTELRWGVTAKDSAGLDGVVELVARERGGVPGLWKPLGRILGTCHGDEACRAELIASAESAAGEAGLVPVLELLTAGTVGDLEDPAFATSLLLAELLLRQSEPEQLGALLEGLEPGLSQAEVRRVVRASLGTTPESLDRSLRRQVLAGRRDRLGR